MEIQRSVEEFIKNGGKITEVPPSDIGGNICCRPNWKRYTSVGRRKAYQGDKVIIYKLLGIMGY